MWSNAYAFFGGGNIHDLAFENSPEYHFQSDHGNGLISDCACIDGWQGSFCEYENCPATLPQLSLLSLFFNSDATLKAFSNQFNPLFKDDQFANAGLYLYNLLSSTVDINGDGKITKQEAIQSLGYRSVYSPLFSQSPIGMKLWCNNNVNGFLTGGCYKESDDVLRDDAEVAVSDVYYDGLNYFLTSNKHTFGTLIFITIINRLIVYLLCCNDGCCIQMALVSI